MTPPLCWWRFRTAWRTIAATIFFSVGLLAAPGGGWPQDSSASAKVTPCVNPITACGCTIIKPGFYNVTNDLNAGSGLTAKGGCIDIKASKVVLNTGHLVAGPGIAGYDITGPGGGTPTG